MIHNMNCPKMDRMGMAATRCACIYKTHERTVTTWRSEWTRRWGMTETQVFHSQPMLGPSTSKKRRLSEHPPILADAGAAGYAAPRRKGPKGPFQKKKSKTSQEKDDSMVVAAALAEFEQRQLQQGNDIDDIGNYQEL